MFARFRMPDIKNIVFDLGGVLIDWNPRYLFTEVFENEDELEHFLSNICSNDWNEEQDAGRSLELGTELLVRQHPEYENQIRMFYGDWEKMLGGPISSNLSVFEALKVQGIYEIYALTNWSAETFPIALARFSFLKDFEGILVSGVEGMRKPFPEFYQLLLHRFKLKPEETLFIDDNGRNIAAASQLKFQTIHLPAGADLALALSQINIFVSQT